MTKILITEFIDSQSLQNINKKFDEVDYCKDCDHLIDVPESLVWTNIKKREYGGSRVSFIDYVGSEKNFK